MGNLLLLKKAFAKQNEFSKSITVEVCESVFKDNFPKMFIDFKFPQLPTIIVNDPECVNELYVTKNKYFDKDDKTKTVMSRLLGDSIVFSKSDELWAKKRKSLSVAFYKDKLVAMLETITQMTSLKVR